MGYHFLADADLILKYEEEGRLLGHDGAIEYAVNREKD